MARIWNTPLFILATLYFYLVQADQRADPWQPRRPHHPSGALWRYAQTVGPAASGAVVHPGGGVETAT